MPSSNDMQIQRLGGPTLNNEKSGKEVAKTTQENEYSLSDPTGVYGESVYKYK
jgi:hypothetical protein